eukprot:Nk52_evm1s2456 gene=Nk52_evmTU1s2456
MTNSAKGQKNQRTPKVPVDREGDLIIAPVHSVMDHYKSLVNNEYMSDIKFILGEEKYPIHAHRVILAARSEVFKLSFAEMNKGELSEEEFCELPEVRPSIFVQLMEYIYTGSLTIKNATVIDIMASAIEYQMEELIDICGDYIFDNTNTENVCEYLQASIAYKQDELEDFLFDFLEANCQAVLKSKSFVELTEDTLLKIVSSDNLQCNEFDLFTAVKDWGSVNSVVQGITIDEAMEKVITKIRFPILSSDDLLKVDEEARHLTYIPLERIAHAWKFHAIQQKDPSDPLLKPRRYNSHTDA